MKHSLRFVQAGRGEQGAGREEPGKSRWPGAELLPLQALWPPVTTRAPGKYAQQKAGTPSPLDFSSYALGTNFSSELGTVIKQGGLALSRPSCSGEQSHCCLLDTLKSRHSWGGGTGQADPGCCIQARGGLGQGTGLWWSGAHQPLLVVYSHETA